MALNPRQIYDDALVIGGLSVCNWNSDAVFRQLRAGNITAINAIDDIVERVGIDHVAIGTDSTHDQPLEFWHFIASQQGTKFPSTFADGSVPYTEVSFQPRGKATLAEFPDVADALANRGYNAGEITKLLGGNWMRLFAQVWNV